MRHALIVKGNGVGLRPVRLDDAPFIVWLRNLDYVKGRVGDSAADVAVQERWLKSYFEKEGDYYFIVETINEIPLGTLAIYDVKGSSAEVGRIVIRPGVSASAPALVLIFDLAYGQLGITQVRATSVAGNHKAHIILRKHGFRQVKVEQAGRVIGGQAVDILHFVQTAEDWFRVREQRIAPARLAETRIREWEQAYLKNYGTQGLVTET